MPKVNYGKESIELGTSLKQIRVSKDEKLAVVSSELGIDKTYLSKIENGHVRPSRAVLEKLIKYYGVLPSQATEFYKLAGFNDYTRIVASEISGKEVQNMDNKSVPTVGDPNALQVNVPNDQPILYSDSVFVTRNNFGVVLDFAQILGSTNRHNVVARIGMSKDHAEALLNVLQEELSKEISAGKKAVT